MIAFDAIRALVEGVGPDLWQMNGEIEKLVAYASGTEITSVMVKELVKSSFEGQIFALIDAVSRKQSEETLRLLREERWSGANDFYLMTMLARQVRVLIAARAMLEENPYATKQDLASAMNIHPFVAQKALSQAKTFSLDVLKQTHALLFQFDQGMKSGQLHADMAVDLIAAKMLT
jgi:DNA polymerase-3 subunit delta